MSAPSLKRVEMNRQNAQKSTGPKDSTSTRYNAVKHGLLAEGVTELDDAENFVGLCEQLEAEYSPVGLVEIFFVRRIALCMIRLRRAGLIEAEYLTADLNPAISTGDSDRLLMEMLRSGEVIDPGLPARLSLDAVEQLVTKFQRYETAIESKLYRAINQLEDLQRTRRGQSRTGAKAADSPIQSGKLLASFGNQPHQ
jgi:hypothetical protein